MADAHQFPQAPDDRRSPEQITAQRAAVRTQIAAWLAEMAASGGPREDHVRALTDLQERRSGLGPARIRLEEDGTAVTPNRLVVRRADVPRVLAELEAMYYAPQVVAVPGVDDLRVLVTVGAGARSLRASGAVARAVTAGRAAPSHVSLLGAIRKAAGGPEPSGPGRGGSWDFQAEPRKGGDPVVAVVDNGVSAEQRGDGWLAGLAGTDNLDLLDVVPADHYLDRAAGHGTFTAGIVQQVAPGARLVLRRALDTEGEGDEVDIGREVVRAAQDGAEVINLSLGFQTADDRPPLAMERALRSAIAIADRARRHLLVVCAAGNFGDDGRPCWPAAFAAEPGFERHVVAVAALRLDDRDDQQVVGAEWSSRGDWVTCSTLGQGVVSTYVIGEEAPSSDALDPDVFGPSSWATWSGTSFAAPQVAGAVVRMVRDRRAPSARAALDALLAEAGVHSQRKNGTPRLDGFGVPLRILPV
ncbi:Subtilase family protein [Geodermatophilus saharensis]|uniref:Subtilase family protein n=1 Tax=Geodermatophilus saharensis TaxID=1137994 RepID=A0A239D103_9ACTN|nr:S8/S53 family peptidase [Geodermatophilus saharensis]SNS25551.1 Subtilase family protein [Geodermatophilus saharensis]